ncbi:uncharacterized protein KY384_004585 [Bacidia gigantensis]|uniref:uncharacterized protein n=1 Tax=Bacidia gigantensis TaxID=2732470 RepID=UPI001D04727B|nr:uncharacterized protein KY384_004585 [Bacidia gigantensis]KAG8531227.1 hypothetical protein KY384_004585 [Bacidia gigantensis]
MATADGSTPPTRNGDSYSLFSIDNEDGSDELQFRAPIKKQLEAQYQRWKDHDRPSIFKGSAGFYNALPSPVITQFVQTSYDKNDILYVVAMYPVVNFEYLADYESRKMFEIATNSIQKYGPAGLPTIAQPRYLRRFDFPSETNLARHDFTFDEDGPERIQSARALYSLFGPETDMYSREWRKTTLPTSAPLDD